MSEQVCHIDSLYFKKNEKIAVTLNKDRNKRIDLCLTVREQKIHLNVSQRRREREALFFSYVVSIPQPQLIKRFLHHSKIQPHYCFVPH